MENYHHFRQNYGKYQLDKEVLKHNPFDIFNNWFTEVLDASVVDANAMIISTCADGIPSSRVVLLKEISKGGFVFFTNYKSRKGKELDANAQVALLFFWPAFERQVRIEGIASKLSKEESESYFHSRPLESRIAAVISPQSEVITDKNILISAFQNELEKKIEPPMPHYWGGYRVMPAYFEFWQGGAHRLHDRFAFKKINESWIADRLAP